jgi:hypothetical protein
VSTHCHQHCSGATMPSACLIFVVEHSGIFPTLSAAVFALMTSRSTTLADFVCIHSWYVTEQPFAKPLILALLRLHDAQNPGMDPGAARLQGAVRYKC